MWKRVILRMNITVSNLHIFECACWEGGGYFSVSITILGISKLAVQRKCTVQLARALIEGHLRVGHHVCLQSKHCLQINSIECEICTFPGIRVLLIRSATGLNATTNISLTARDIMSHCR